jgi:hypothetical protein
MSDVRRPFAKFARYAAGISFVIACLAGLGAAQAPHSYAMFDSSATRKVRGTIAKLEWVNPHVFLWIYVPKPGGARGHDLYAFENGSPSVLSGRGWSPGLFKAGERITVEYWPLRSGRNGGHVEKVDLANGRTLVGAGGPGRF